MPPIELRPSKDLESLTGGSAIPNGILNPGQKTKKTIGKINLGDGLHERTVMSIISEISSEGIESGRVEFHQDVVSYRIGFGPFKILPKTERIYPTKTHELVPGEPFSLGTKEHRLLEIELINKNTKQK